MYYFLFVADLSSTHLQHRDTDTEKHGIIASMTAIRHFTLSSVYLKKKKWKKRKEKKRKEKKKTEVQLTHKKIWYCQIQEVVIALPPQTLVHFKSQDDQRVAQNYHNHQSHHHRHQEDKHGSREDEAVLHPSWGIAKIVPAGVGATFLLRHGASLNPQQTSADGNEPAATGARREDAASSNPHVSCQKRRLLFPAAPEHNAAEGPPESARRSPQSAASDNYAFDSSGCRLRFALSSFPAPSSERTVCDQILWIMQIMVSDPASFKE